ncbi:MAG: molybdopterin-dependent oxidoreductase [Planctomycetota bacterium]
MIDRAPAPGSPPHRTSCPLDCPDACGVLVETDAEGRFVRLRGNKEHHWSRGSLCGKTAIYHELVLAPNRLTQPLVREGSGHREATWDEALGVIAKRMEGLAGDDVLALNYAGNMGLVQRRFPLRLMHALDATFHDGGVCDATAERGFQLVMGRSIGPDLDVETTPERCDLFVLWGSDAKRTSPHLMGRLKALCAAGVPVFVVDVYRTETVRTVEGWGGTGVLVEPGSDGALALGLAARAFDERAADLAYLKDHCTGAAELRAELAGAWPKARVLDATGLDGDAYDALFRALIGAQRPLVKAGIGFARRRNGGDNMRAIASMTAVLGHGDRMFFQTGDHFGLEDEIVSRPDVRPGPGRPPVSQVGVGKELEGGRFRSAFVWGHNPASVLPDSGAVRRGLARDDLFLVVHELFMTETARLADVVLPATALPEHSDLLRSYGHRTLQAGWRAVEPRGEARSNVGTFSAIGRALGFVGERGFPDEVTGPLFEQDEDALVGALLAQNRARFTSDEYRRLVHGDPVKLRDRALDGRGTPSGKIELSSETAEAEGVARVAQYTPDDGAGGKGTFRLISAPSTATHNTTYMHVSRHAQRLGAPRAYVHPKDAADVGVEEGAPLRLVSEHGAITLVCALDEDARRKTVRVDGFVDESLVPERIGVNALVSPDVSDLGGGNVLYSTRVELVPGSADAFADGGA